MRLYISTSIFIKETLFCQLIVFFLFCQQRFPTRRLDSQNRKTFVSNLFSKFDVCWQKRNDTFLNVSHVSKYLILLYIDNFKLHHIYATFIGATQDKLSTVLQNLTVVLLRKPGLHSGQASKRPILQSLNQPLLLQRGSCTSCQASSQTFVYSV